jgi:hypothetical protein
VHSRTHGVQFSFTIETVGWKDLKGWFARVETVLWDPKGIGCSLEDADLAGLRGSSQIGTQDFTIPGSSITADTLQSGS